MDLPSLLARLRLTHRRALRLMIGGGVALAASGPAALASPRAAHSAPDVGVLRRRLRGEVVARTDTSYEAVRAGMVWNARKPDRRPDLIVRAAGVEDVQAAVRFAREHGLTVAVRGGGHSYSGAPLRDGGLLIDLGAMRAIDVDAPARRASVQPAAIGAELVAALSPHGLAFPVGHCPSVPLSGYILGGGFGWNSGSWGPAWANVVAVELVSARGEVLRASETENADLFWAVRGGGPGFFGVVTRFELALHPLPAEIWSTTAFYRLDDLDRIAAWLAGIRQGLNPGVELTGLMLAAPPDVPADLLDADGRVLLLTATAFAGNRPDAEAWLAPIQAGPGRAPRHLVPLAPTPLQALHQAMAAVFPEGLRVAADVLWCDADAASVMRTVRDSVAAAPSPRSFTMIVLPPSPPADAPAPPDMALSMFAPVLVGVYGITSDPEDDPVADAWVRTVNRRLGNAVVGHYIAETDLTAAHDRARRCFAPRTWQWLEELRRVHDPDGVFHTFQGPA